MRIEKKERVSFVASSILHPTGPSGPGFLHPSLPKAAYKNKHSEA